PVRLRAADVRGAGRGAPRSDRRAHRHAAQPQGARRPVRKARDAAAARRSGEVSAQDARESRRRGGRGGGGGRRAGGWGWGGAWGGGRAPCQGIVIREGDVDLSQFPVPVSWPEDGGPYITLAGVITRDSETGVRNVGMYRVQVIGPNAVAMHWQRHKVGAAHW